MEAEIYERFEKLCMSETFDIINEYIKKFNVDINYDNGYYLELICERNDIDLLRKFIGLGGNIHLNNEGPYDFPTFLSCTIGWLLILELRLLPKLGLYVGATITRSPDTSRLA